MQGNQAVWPGARWQQYELPRSVLLQVVGIEPSLGIATSLHEINLISKGGVLNWVFPICKRTKQLLEWFGYFSRSNVTVTRQFRRGYAEMSQE